MNKFLMSRNGKIAMGILLVLILLYFMYKPQINSMYYKRFGKTRNQSPDAVGNIGQIDEKKVLKKGSTGLEVKKLQSLLKAKDSKYLPKYGVDGGFGDETEAALIDCMGVKQITLKEWYTKHPQNTGVAGNITGGNTPALVGYTQSNGGGNGFAPAGADFVSYAN